MKVADAEGAEISLPGSPPQPGRRLLVGFDGSPSAAAAIDVGALFVPRATAWIVTCGRRRSRARSCGTGFGRRLEVWLS